MTFPPIHPILVNFTAGLIPAAFIFDLLAAWTKKDSLRAAAWWTLLLAAAVTPVTALTGWLWMRSMEHSDHWQMPIHMWLGIALAGLLVPLAGWRGWLYRQERTPGWSYLITAVIVLAGLIYQGELGGSMSFGSGIVVSADWIHDDASEDRENDHGSGASGHPEQHHSHGASDSSQNHDFLQSK